MVVGIICFMVGAFIGVGAICTVTINREYPPDYKEMECQHCRSTNIEHRCKVCGAFVEVVE